MFQSIILGKYFKINFRPYIAPLNLDEGDFDVLLLHGNASHSLNCWSILGTENDEEPEIWVHDHLHEVS